MTKRITRREFLAVSGGLAVALAGVQPRAPRALAGALQSRVIFRLSLRGRRGSKAAKLHNANMRFATASSAELHRAHPGDNSRVVQLTVSESVYNRLFPSPDRVVADLRKVVVGCIGDCNHNGGVTKDDVLKMVNNALGHSQTPVCARGDANRDSRITVDEILIAVNNPPRECR